MRTRPEATIFRVGQHYVHRMEGQAGAVIDEHRHHHYAHEMYVERGRVRIAVNGVPAEHEGPQVVTIPSGTLHGIAWLSDAVVSCWHVCRFSDGREFPFDFAASEHQFDEAVSNL